jgi:hypothetical protein
MAPNLEPVTRLEADWHPLAILCIYGRHSIHSIAVGSPHVNTLGHHLAAYDDGLLHARANCERLAECGVLGTKGLVCPSAARYSG